MSLGERILFSLAVLLLSIAIGWGAELFLRYIARWLSRRTRWVWDGLLVESLRGLLIVGSIIAALAWLIRWWQVPEQVSAVLGKILLIALLVTIFVWLLRFSVRFFQHLLHSGDGRIPSVSILTNLVRLGVLILGLLVILQVLGVSITPLLTALGIGGLAVALALQDTLSNLFAGLHILAARQLHPGDFIQLDSGHEGFVEDINWRTTTIRTLPNNLVIIPNSRLANAIVVNYRVPQPETAVPVPVSVAYGSDLEQVERVTLEVARRVQAEVPGAVRDFEPVIRFQSFGDSGINLTVILRVQKVEDQYLLRHEFIKRLYSAYAKEGIQIPFPMRHLTGKVAVHLTQGIADSD